MVKTIVLFVEDYGHEQVIGAIIQRLAHENRMDVEIFSRSCRWKGMQCSGS